MVDQQSLGLMMTFRHQDRRRQQKLVLLRTGFVGIVGSGFGFTINLSLSRCPILGLRMILIQFGSMDLIDRQVVQVYWTTYGKHVGM